MINHSLEQWRRRLAQLESSGAGGSSLAESIRRKILGYQFSHVQALARLGKAEVAAERQARWEGVVKHSYTSPMQFNPMLTHGAPTVSPDLAVPGAKLDARSARLALRYREALMQSHIGRQYRIGAPKVIGSQVHFGIGSSGTISVPLLGPTYSKGIGALSGTPVGYQGIVNMIQTDGLGARVMRGAESITDVLRSSTSLTGLRSALSERAKLLRYRDVEAHRLVKAPSIMSSMSMLHHEQFRVAPGSVIPVGVGPYEAISIGSGQVYGMSGGARKLIDDPAMISQLLHPVLQHMRKATGLPLHYDPTSESPLGLGRFASFNEADIDPYGFIQKRGFKFAQQFRTIPLGVGSRRGKMFGGRLIQTALERSASVRAAGFGIPSGQALVTGANVPMRMLFGEAAMRAGFIESNQYAISERLASTMQALTLHPKTGQAVPYAIGLPTYSSTGKGNISRILAGGSHLGQAARPGVFSRPAEMFQSVLGAYAQAAMDRGVSLNEFSDVMMGAMGRSKFSGRGGGTAVLKEGVRLFSRGGEAMAPEAALTRMTRIFRVIGGRLGIGTEDLVTREGGRIAGMRVFEHFGARDVGANAASSYMRHGLNIQGGQTIAANYSSLFRALGSDTLAGVFSQARSNPELMAAIDFRKQVLASTLHLVDPAMAGRIKIRGAAASISLSDMSASLAGKWSQVNKMIEAAGASKGGLARAVKNAGLLPQLFRGTGVTLNLGQQVAIEGTLSKTFASAPLSGAIQELAIPNLMHSNIGDQIAYRMLRLAQHAGDEGKMSYEASKLVSGLMGGYVGGKDSLLASLINPRVGSEMIARAQGVDPKAFQAGVGQYLDNLHRAGLLTKSQRAAMDPTKQRFGFVSRHKFREMMPFHRDFLRKEQYLPVVTTRDPVHGHAVAMRLLNYHEKHMPPELRRMLSGLRGGEGIVSAVGDARFLRGDYDYDHLRMLIAAGRPDDQASMMLQRGFGELEGAQLRRMQAADDDAVRAFTKATNNAAGMLDDLFSAIGGKEASGALKDAFAKVGARDESMVAQMGVKMFTGLAHSHSNLRQIAMEAFEQSGTPLFKGNELARGYYSMDLLHGMQQLFINKHSVAGKSSLEALRDMNSLMQMAGRSAADRQNAKDALVEMMATVHSVVDPQVGLHQSQAFGQELFGQSMAGKNIDEVRQILRSSGNKTVESILEAEMSMAGTLEWARGATPHLKDARTTDQLLEQARTLSTVAQADKDPVRRAMASMMGAQTDAAVEILDRVPTSSQAAKVAEEVAATTARQGFRKEARQAVNKMGFAIVDAVNKHPVAAGLAATAAAGMIVMSMMRKAGGTIDHIAGQEAGGPSSPRSEYYVPEDSVIGSQLSGQANLPPEAIGPMLDQVNAMDPSADVRVMDTRSRMSHRVMGYDAENVMSSLYARNQLR